MFALAKAAHGAEGSCAVTAPLRVRSVCGPAESAPRGASSLERRPRRRNHLGAGNIAFGDGVLPGAPWRAARQAGLGSRGCDRAQGAPERGLSGFLRPARARLGHPRRGRPSGQGSALERSHRFLHSNFEAGRRFANHIDFQHQLDGWCARINARVHRTTRAVVSERLAKERKRMRALPASPPDTNRRSVTCVPAQPCLQFDRNDYSLDLVGRRVEVRASQTEITAVCLDTGELACRHARVFAGGLCFTDPAHQAAVDPLRGERRRRRSEPDVELRPLARYDQPPRRDPLARGRLVPATRQAPRRAAGCPNGRNRLTDQPRRPRQRPQNGSQTPVPYRFGWIMSFGRGRRPWGQRPAARREVVRPAQAVSETTPLRSSWGRCSAAWPPAR
jgi:hypothetical protein